jgi:hypothetical protein
VTASCCVKMNDSMEIVPDSGERFGQLQSQVQQFPVNAWRAPTRIGRAHLANQIDELARDRRPALPMATLPAPVQPKSLSVPGDHRFRLDNRKGRSPTIPKLREPCPEDSICDAELYFVGTLQTLKDQELMTKGHDLRMERSSVSVSLSNRMEQREDDREHIERTVSGSSPKFNWLNQYGVFGRDKSDRANKIAVPLRPRTEVGASLLGSPLHVKGSRSRPLS